MDRNWDLVGAVILFSLVLFGAGYWVGHVRTQRKDAQAVEEMVFEPIIRKAYISGFADALLLNKRIPYTVVGKENVCLLSPTSHELECNYTTLTACETYNTNGDYCIETDNGQLQDITSKENKQ